GMSRHADLVHHLCRERSPHRGERTVVDHLTMGGDPGLVQSLERPLQATTRGGPPRVAVDDVPAARWADGRDDGHANRPLLGPATQRPDQAPPVSVSFATTSTEVGGASGSLTRAPPRPLWPAPAPRGERRGLRTRTGLQRPAGS